jgi:hypothetical protein
MNRNSNRHLNRYDRTAIAALIRWGILCGGLGFGVVAWAKAGEEALPPELAPVVISAVQRDAVPLYRVNSERGDYRAENPALGWAVRFGTDWVEVKLKGESAAWGLRLRLIGFGAAEVKPVPALRGRTVAGNRVSYDRGRSRSGM